MDSSFFEFVIFVGRLLFVFVFLGSAVGHLTQTPALAAYAEMRGVPSPKVLVQVSGVAMAAGGVSVLLGIWGDIGALGLAVLMVVTAVMMHAFWKETDPQAKQMEMIAFNKDIALAGGALAIFYVLAYDGPYTLTNALISWY